MSRSQGKYFSKDEVDRIVMLLRESDMTLREIADRMRCSRSAVAAINRKFQVRVYSGKRSEWSVNCGNAAIAAKTPDSTSVVLQ
jgi:transcriptional regulator